MEQTGHTYVDHLNTHNDVDALAASCNTQASVVQIYTFKYLSRLTTAAWDITALLILFVVGMLHKLSYTTDLSHKSICHKTF